ncbi:MAG TPA: type I restriction endonuclease subunit R [Gammaproteobacteria bacterium]
MHDLPRFQEEFSAKLPALALLHNLGWEFLTPAEAVRLRDGKFDQVVLKDVLRENLRKRRFVFNGEEQWLTESTIEGIVTEVCNPALNEGLLKANERIYNHLLYGIAVNQFVDGRKANPTIALIDWHNPANNTFLFTEEFPVLRADGVNKRRPDIVCFVNGIPFVVIEAKRPDGHGGKAPTIDEGISQHLRNQRMDEIPQLYAYAQLLVSISGVSARYGTVLTEKKFWTVWKDEEFDEARFHEMKNHASKPDFVEALFRERSREDREWFEGWCGGGLDVTDQDRLLTGLLDKGRLLELVRFFSFFDRKAGRIVARYPQFFAIRALLDQVQKKRPDGSRDGGVIWHTTGSGKSFTMVFLSRALILHEALKQCRIVVVTDRVDLERQLSGTFRTSGELAGKRDAKDAMATSGRRLAQQIGKGTERIVFSLVQKFNTAARLPECRNDSADIIVLVDEGHRTHGGESHVRMRQALPNAALVAFTGTPLLKDEKTTNKFGRIVHAYTMQRAVEDGTVTPLLYEERVPDLDVNDRAVDSWFARITEGLTEKQRADLKRKYTTKGALYKAEDRIRLIALDVANHLHKHLDSELKAQLACDSKISAIRYKRFLDEAGLFESAVVMSPPDSRVDNTEVDEAAMPEIQKWWKANVGNLPEADYTKDVIWRFEKDNDLKLLIVVDRLLTGFDEPKNAVLYIDKPLKEHNLIQAIARVNRLHPRKKHGYLIDYRGILTELDTTIAKYQDLAARTQSGYDIDDLAGLYQSMSTEYKRLPRLYAELWDVFRSVRNRNDYEQFRQVLIPKMKTENGETFDANQKKRDEFYARLTAFSTCLNVALQSATFFEDAAFTEDDRWLYKKTLREMRSLRQRVREDAGEAVHYGEYEDDVRKLVDKHVVGVGVKEPEAIYDIGLLGAAIEPEKWTDEKTRNETDLIRTRITRKIEQDLADDPYARETFSKLLQQVIEEAEKLFDHPLKQYFLFREFEEKVAARETPGIPEALRDNRHAQACFGVFRKVLTENFAGQDDAHAAWVELAFTCDREVDQAVAENSVNPQNIDAAIRKKLLPLVFQQCKRAGAGIEQAKQIVEWIVQITRVGLGKP